MANINDVDIKLYEYETMIVSAFYIFSAVYTLHRVVGTRGIAHSEDDCNIGTSSRIRHRSGGEGG